jgi:hypothetical protein
MPTADELRAVALGLPGVVERETWGHPTFRVRDKMFGTLAADGTTASMKASREEQAALVQGDPSTFFVPQYVGVHGWVAFRLGRVDADEMRELVVEAWRMTAAKRVVRAFDEGAGPAA